MEKDMPDLDEIIEIRLKNLFEVVPEYTVQKLYWTFQKYIKPKCEKEGFAFDSDLITKFFEMYIDNLKKVVAKYSKGILDCLKDGSIGIKEE